MVGRINIADGSERIETKARARHRDHTSGSRDDALDLRNVIVFPRFPLELINIAAIEQQRYGTAKPVNGLP
jgi:hypothetical protein